MCLFFIFYLSLIVEHFEKCLTWTENSILCSLAIVTAYENSSQHDPSSNNAMLGVHASASAIIQYGKIARKQGLVNVALDILSRIHTIPTVPIVDCFQKIRQQVKCYLQLAGVMGKNECMQVECQPDPVPARPRPGGLGRNEGSLWKRLVPTTGKEARTLQTQLWSWGTVLPKQERDRKPLEYLNELYVMVSILLG